MFNGVEIEIIPQEIERLRKRDLVHYCRGGWEQILCA